ncbi:MAG: hypothetical protein ABIZ50_01795, partial [Solirubrobacterales bacterium]
MEALAQGEGRDEIVHTLNLVIALGSGYGQSMFGDDAEALEGLRRSEERLRAYAASRQLVLREEHPWPGYVPAALQPGPIKHAVWSLTGELPGGAVGRLRHQAVFGNTFGQDVAGQHTIMICRIPESVGYVPMLACRPDELMSGLYHWGGDQRPRQSQQFESVELERRYVVEVAGGQSQNWIFQLFSPTFIDWLAHSTPQDFGFKLDLGVFTCETPQWRGQAPSLTGEVEPESLDLLLENGGRVASRIRDEVLEEAPLLGEPGEIDSAEAYAEWANRPKHGRIIKALLWAARFVETDDGITKYASERGLETESPARFHARYIGLAMPGAATSVATGRLPAGGREGSLAWLSFSSDVDMEQEYIALATPSPAKLGSTWVDPADVGVPGVGTGISSTALQAAAEGGFGIATSARGVCVYR